MKKRFLSSAICAIAVCVAASCGGSQSESPSSEKTTAGKGLFAEVVTLAHEYESKKDALDEKMEAAGRAQNRDEIEKLMKEKKALQPEFEEKLAAISTKLSGAPVPYELPDTFFYQMATEPAISEVTPTKGGAKCEIQFSVSAKNDLKVEDPIDCTIYMKLVDESGTTLGYDRAYPMGVFKDPRDDKPLEIKAGEVLEKPITVSIKTYSKASSTAEAKIAPSIAKIVFVSESEWEQHNK